MEFVNLNGQVLDTSKGRIKARASTKPKPDVYHKGWLVVGFSPEHLAEAKRLHDADAASQVDPLRRAKPFDPHQHMRIAKPKKARSKPYEVADAAEECAVLMRRAGWQLVQVVPVAKGGRA